MKKNYILFLLIIIVGVFIMTSIGIIYKKVDNSKENKSYISNKVNNYEYKDIESGMNEIKDNGYLYLTYTGVHDNIMVIENADKKPTFDLKFNEFKTIIENYNYELY